MTPVHPRRLATAVLASAAILGGLQWRSQAAGPISGTAFEDFNGNGLRDTTATVASAGSGTTAVAVDRGIAGITVTVYDSAGAVRGTATTAANGTYTVNATGSGPYRVEFTGLPTGYHPSRFASGGTGNGTTVQFVPDGTSTNVNLAVIDAANYCQDNPSVVTSCFVYGDQLTGAFNTNPVVVDFPYSAGANGGVAADYNVPAGHALMVPANAVGSVYGLGYFQPTNTIYAGAYMKKHSGFGSGGTGAIYTINPSTGATALFADLNTIFGAGTAGADPHDTADYDRDNGNATWDAVGKVSLGGLEVSPDGSRVFVVNLADRRVYSLPTSGPLNPGTVQRVQIPLNAPGATGTGGADLRPFALQWYRGQLYVGVVNSAESAGATTADLRAYVYVLDPSTLTFGAAPAFQFALNYPRGSVQIFNGVGPGNWNPWVPGFATQSPAGVGTYPQPMLSALSFDAGGNLTIGLRDRAGDQFGFFALDNPADSQTWEGVAGGDTLFAAINTPGNPGSGWTLESNAQAGTFGPTAGAGNGQGPGTPGGFGEYFFADEFPGLHSELSGGALLQLPGFPDVVTSAFDPGLDVRTGGFMWFNKATGAKTKGYNIYSTGFVAPPQATFSKANGFGEFVAVCQAAPIEIGNRVWDDVDGDGVQDAGEAGLDGVTVQLIAPGGAVPATTVLATAVTAGGGQYYFSSGVGTTTGNAVYGIAGLTANTNGYRVRIDATQGALSGRSLTAGDNDAAANGDSRDSDGAAAGSNAEVVFDTGAAGATTHTYDFGFTTAPLANLSLGDLVWYDTNNNGTRDAGELPIGGVDLVLYRDDGNGTFDATADTPIGTQATSGAGLYLFTGLTPGTYFVQIAPAEFATGQPLNGYQNSSGQTAGDTNNADHGAAAPVAGQGIVSDPVTLSAGGEPTNDGDGSNSNRTIDFGFYRLSLGNLVFNDANNSGTFDTGDTGRDGVTVDLLDATGVSVLATTTTAGGGLYSFTGLAPGDYRVRLTTPAGLASSTGGGSEPAVDPDTDVDDDDNGTTSGVFIVSAPVTLAPGSEPVVTNANGESSNTRVDFGLIPTTLSLGNLVWFDTNNNGSVDGGESGVGGVAVRLIAADGTTVLATTTTNGSGNYLFSNLTPGTYFVEVDRTSTALSGYVSSTDIATSATPDNDVNDDDNGVTATATTVRSGLVTLTANGEPITDGDSDPMSNLTVDFGFVVAPPPPPPPPPAGLSLGDLVWADTNNNGVVDGGEAGIAGVTVRLIAADGVTVLQTTTTDGSGLYLFSGLLAGTYFVEVVPPPGASSSTDIASSAAPNNDLNNDDNGVTIVAGAVRSGPIALAAGTEPTNDGDTSADSNLSVDFGFVPAGGLSLGNLVWLDVNNNGLVDSGEPGLAGVTVRLLAANGSTVLSTTTTNTSGNYLFSSLPAGTYIVEVDRTSSAVTGYLSSTDIASSATPDNDVNNDDNGIAVTPAAVRSAPVTLSALGEPVTDGDSDPNSNLTVDFGFVRALSVGNLVWADVNNNGLVDPGETGVGGVVVRLIAADGVTVLQTTTTNANGRYLFGGLPPATYFVEVVPPSGSQSSTDIGSSGTPNNDIDNDDNGVTISGGAVRSGPITLGIDTEPTNDGDTNPDSNLTVDFGFVPPLGGGLLTDVCLQQVVPASVTPGGQMTATYTAINRGPGAATDVVIDGMLPPGVTVVSTTTSPGGVCTVTPGMLDCRWLGNTPAGPSGIRQVTVVFQVAANVAPGTPVMLWFMTSSSNPDPYPACNMVDAYVFASGGPVAPVDLVIRGAVSAAGATGTTVAAAVNQPVAGRFTVTNTGAAPARGRYVIQLDEAGVLEVASATWSQGWAGVSTATAGVWETELIAPGASATLDLGLVPRTGTAARVQAIRIDGAPADPDAANDLAEFVVDAVGAGGGRFVTVGNVDGAAGGEIVTGNGQGETPQLRVFSGTGSPLADFYAFDRTFLGGVRVASCDVNGDGRDEILAAQGPGGGRVRVLSLAGGFVSEVVAFDAFESGFTGGVNVACADLDLDGRGDVIVGPEGGRAPDVKVFTVGALSAVVTAQFQAYEASFTGGVRVAASRFAGSSLVGAFNIATMPGPGRAMDVRTWQVDGATVTFRIGATLSTATTGARLVLGDIDNDAALDLVVTPDGGSPTLLQAFSLASGAVVLNAPVGAGGFRSVHAAIGILGGGASGQELVVGAGPGQAPTVYSVLVSGGGVLPRLGLTVFETP